MCGIFGIVNLDGAGQFDELRFEHALKTLKHRGPDAQDWIRVGDQALLGHTRLSIIDLSDASNQPMAAHDRYWLVFNGEIFNYLELREELAAEGVTFRTSGDVEVLLNAYIYWGEDCVRRFNGMWSFAIYDRQDRTLFCSRDRFGEKPFNYAVIDGQFYFASEIKAMLAYSPQLAQPDYNVIANFCRTSVGGQHAETWFKKVRRLQPGHNMTIRNGQIGIARYWRYPSKESRNLSFEDAKKEYRARFREAVAVRMRSDVPLGVTLSAGLDSNSITFAMQDSDPASHHCFTSRFLPTAGLSQDSSIYAEAGREIDESVSARRVAQELGLNSHVVDTDYTEFVAPLSDIIWHLESGNSSPAVFPLMQLLKKAREHVTVLLEGQGADELLGGYVANIIWQSFADLIAAGKFREARAALKEYVKTYTLSYSILMALRGASNRLPALSALHQRSSGANAVYGPALRNCRRLRDFPDINDSPEQGWVAATLRRQHSGGLVNLLHYGDAISMANSVESRMPFLDHRLVEFVWGLPAEFKIKLGVGKHIHREAMRGLVPDRILEDRTKFGFNSPIAEQFKKDYPCGGGPIDILLSDRCIERGLFDRVGLQKLIEAHRKGKRDHGPLLFRLLSTELWFRRFIDSEII
jgi:asparagine synthase (glutamine-hydrolysing)